MIARLPKFAFATVAALVIALAAALPAVIAAPPAKGPVKNVTIIAPRWLYLDGDLGIGVRVATRDSTRRVRTEIDLLDETGTSVWHDLQTRADLGSVTYEYSFSKSVSDLGIKPGIFTLRARVTSFGTATVERTARLIVADRSMRPVAVCLIVRVAATPSTGTTVSAGLDATSQVTAADAADLGRLAELRPDLRLTLAVPPFLLEQWSVAGPDGEETSTPAAGAEALDSLRRAALAGTPLLRGMFADPDLSGIATATTELGIQAARGDAAADEAFAGEAPAPSVTASGFAALSGPLPARAAAVMAARGVRFAVTGTSSVAPARGAAATGGYLVMLPVGTGSALTTLVVLTTDRAASLALTDPAAATDLATDLFTRASSAQKVQTVVLVEAVGADGMRTAQLAEAIETLVGIPWVRFVTAPAAAASGGLPAATLKDRPEDPSPAPAGYWTEVASARARVSGLVAAAGRTDADARRALDALLLAESRAWAGPDGSWPLVDRGRALARTAAEAADAVLSKVTLDAPSVTLPGSEGKAPVSILNASGRSLVVELEATSSDVRVLRPHTTVNLRPGENVLSVPVSLGTSASGRLRFEVTAGGFRIATETAAVSASYQDRIVLLSTVLLVLAGLLFYIRRHVARGRTQRSGLEDSSGGPESR